MQPVLDRAHFNHMTGFDRDLQREIIVLFEGQVESWRAALAGGGEWRSPVHTMKGSARGIGLGQLTAACEAAERAFAAEIPGCLTEVSAALDQALSALAEFAAEDA